MMKDGIKMRQFLSSFLVPSLTEPVEQAEISVHWDGMQ